MHAADEARLLAWVNDTPWLMAALRTARELAPPGWAIGAGALRNMVWDRLHGIADPQPASDIDLIWYDPVAPAGEDGAICARLQARMPTLDWEVVNQAHVHRWLGSPLTSPLRDLHDAVAGWPETATAIALRLEPDDRFTLIAPFGLDDVFGLVVRHNPRISADVYRQRLHDKAYCARWPKLAVLPPA